MTGFRTILGAFRSWRTLSVSLLSFSSGIPLGLVWIAIPDWMRDIGVDIRIVGLFNLAQIPWAFKVLWSPFMDRYVPGFWGRRRGWMAVTQVALLGLCLLLGGVGDDPDAIWVVGALALALGVASASQDIVVDAYAVEVLRPEEHGVAVGARVALYRAAMLVAGGGAISLAALFGWGVVNALLGLIFFPMLFVTWRAPEPEESFQPPRTLRDAVWKPFLEALSRPRALEILAFVFFYKFADNLAQALTRPFLIDMGYGGGHRGIALGTVGLVAVIAGTFAGGMFTTLVGLGPALWAFGALQIFSNLGYFFVAGADGSLAWMYGASAFELLTGGLGTGAFSVLLLRITEKRFSATQYALFSGLFALPRLLAGPFSGFAVDAIGWRTFFLSTMAMGIPGLILLHRFSPLGVRDPEIRFGGGDEPAAPRLSSGLAGRFTIAALLGGGTVFGFAVLLGALKALRLAPESGFSLIAGLNPILNPASFADWVQVGGIVVLGLISGLFGAAFAAARRRG